VRETRGAGTEEELARRGTGHKTMRRIYSVRRVQGQCRLFWPPCATTTSFLQLTYMRRTTSKYDTEGVRVSVPSCFYHFGNIIIPPIEASNNFIFVTRLVSYNYHVYNKADWFVFKMYGYQNVGKSINFGTYLVEDKKK